MIRIIAFVVSIVIVCTAICYTTNRVCNTIDKTNSLNTEEHAILQREHNALYDVSLSTKHIAQSNNEMLTKLLNIANSVRNTDK